MIPHEIKLLYRYHCNHKISNPRRLVSHPDNTYTIKYNVSVLDAIIGWTFEYCTTTYFHPVDTK